jgi:transcriptional regulator with XRE-family HTH domain
MPRGHASDDPTLPIIARNLRVTRADLKLKQGDVENQAGLPSGQLSRWEKARAKPEVDALLKVAAVYGCHVDDLLGGVYEPYDELIASGVGPDMRRHYEARISAIREAAVVAFRNSVRASETAPTKAAPSASAQTGRGKSKPIRARRAPGK